MREAIGNDGQWHPWEELTEEERDKWCMAMNESDRLWEQFKYHGKPITITEKFVQYEQEHRIC